MKNTLLAYTLRIVTLIGCDEDPAPALAPEAEDFLNEVVDIMEENSINARQLTGQISESRYLKKLQLQRPSPALILQNGSAKNAWR